MLAQAAVAVRDDPRPPQQPLADLPPAQPQRPMESSSVDDAGADEAVLTEAAAAVTTGMRVPATAAL